VGISRATSMARRQSGSSPLPGSSSRQPRDNGDAQHLAATNPAGARFPVDNRFARPLSSQPLGEGPRSLIRHASPLWRQDETHRRSTLRLGHPRSGHAWPGRLWICSTETFPAYCDTARTHSGGRPGNRDTPPATATAPRAMQEPASFPHRNPVRTTWACARLCLRTSAGITAQ